MTADAVVNETRYVVAVTVQRDIPNGVSTHQRLAWFTSHSPDFTTQDAIDWSRKENGLSSEEYRTVAYYVGRCVPFDVPTRCIVSLTMMPGGAGFSSRLREKHREFTISPEFSVVDAFEVLMGEEFSDSVVGYRVNPVQLS